MPYLICLSCDLVVRASTVAPHALERCPRCFARGGQRVPMLRSEFAEPTQPPAPPKLQPS
jgi:hypothetical protein